MTDPEQLRRQLAALREAGASEATFSPEGVLLSVRLEPQLPEREPPPPLPGGGPVLDRPGSPVRVRPA